MTYDINEHYGVTISQAQAGRPFIAVGELFSRKTMRNIGIEGRSWSAASSRAIADARANCPADPPDDE